jgi:hypothetical protein
MAKKKISREEKIQFLNTIKGEKKIYEIMLSGYGGEIAVGSISKEQYGFWKEREDFEEHCNDWDNEMEIPEDMQIVRDGCWHDVDNLAHECGAEFSDLNYITVYDKKSGDMVFESPLGYEELERHGIDPDGFAVDEFYISGDSEAEYAFIGQSVEKGTFFTGEIEIIGDFDPRRLSFSYIDVEGWNLVNGVSYESQIIDDTGGYSTTGKSLDFKIFKVEK